MLFRSVFAVCVVRFRRLLLYAVSCFIFPVRVWLLGLFSCWQKIMEFISSITPYLPSFVPVFLFPLVTCWGILLAVDFVVTLFLNSSRSSDDKKDKGNIIEKAYGFFYGNGPLPLGDTVALIWGGLMLIFLAPIVAFVVGLAVLWEFLDRGGRGKPLSGIVMSFAQSVNSSTAAFTGLFTRHQEDGFILNVVLFLGGVIPLTLFLSLDYTLANGFSLPLCIAYHVFRIGPFFMNFAYTYTLCHKEGHTRLGFYNNPILNFILKNSFNWWIGLFFGVMPSSFACGHSINHHKYNNGPLDVVSTADKPRDNFGNFVRFVPRFFLYAVNVSTIRQFYFEGDMKTSWKMLMGTIFYFIWFGMFFRLSPIFAVAYILYPLLENVILLACIQWCWHAFLDPQNPENPYVGSITVLQGPINVLGEDFHVVHHQYPGTHWTTHQAKYEKHLSEYTKLKGAVFENTHAFEMFFLIILKKYREIAERFHDYSGTLKTIEEKEELIKTYLRTCWWGPTARVDYKQHGWEGVQDSDGFQ